MYQKKGVCGEPCDWRRTAFQRRFGGRGRGGGGEVRGGVMGSKYFLWLGTAERKQAADADVY